MTKKLFYNGDILTLEDELYAEAVLVEDGKIKAVGTDAMTVDAYIHDNYPAHDIFLNKEILIIENLNNIDKLPDNFIFIALPLKIANGSASPIRAVALY